MAVDTDLERMLRVGRGDAESFELLLRRHRAPLVSYLVRMVQDRALAEGLGQEVFLREYQRGSATSRKLGSRPGPAGSLPIWR